MPGQPRQNPKSSRSIHKKKLSTTVTPRAAVSAPSVALGGRFEAPGDVQGASAVPPVFPAMVRATSLPVSQSTDPEKLRDAAYAVLSMGPRASVSEVGHLLTADPFNLHPMEAQAFTTGVWTAAIILNSKIQPSYPGDPPQVRALAQLYRVQSSLWAGADWEFEPSASPAPLPVRPDPVPMESHSTTSSSDMSSAQSDNEEEDLPNTSGEVTFKVPLPVAGVKTRSVTESSVTAGVEAFSASLNAIAAEPTQGDSQLGTPFPSLDPITGDAPSTDAPPQIPVGCRIGPFPQ